jgi:PAS domain S-box-containing protein
MSDNKPELEKLIKVVDQLDPFTLTPTDIADIKAWGADKVGFVLIDIDTQKITYATEGAEKIFGYVTDEMVGLDLVELVPDEFKNVHAEHVKGFGEAMQARSMGRRDSPLYGKERDGATFPVEIGLFPRKFKGRKVCLANVVRLSKEV